MKYLLINQQTGKETICEKVSIDEFDYYVCAELPSIGDKSILDEENFGPLIITHHIKCEIGYEGKKIIATNNHYLDIPQVVDEDKVIKLAFKHIACTKDSQFDRGVFHGFVAGYHKSQETHPFSEEDMVEFAVWLNDTDGIVKQTKHIDFSKSDKEVAKELLQLWKSQQPKKVYYKKTTDK